jgi:hypothetical protein
VIDVLNKLNVPYLIAGSFASSIHGQARSTNDIDLVVDMAPKHVDPLVVALEPDFYMAREQIDEAIERRTSFNAIHFKTSFKVGIFLPQNSRFDALRFENRTLECLGNDPGCLAYISSAEDVILAKLAWYRLGNEISDRQWRDILDVIKVQGANLNKNYLNDLALELGVADLLEKAFPAHSE